MLGPLRLATREGQKAMATRMTMKRSEPSHGHQPYVASIVDLRRWTGVRSYAGVSYAGGGNASLSDLRVFPPTWMPTSFSSYGPRIFLGSSAVAAGHLLGQLGGWTPKLGWPRGRREQAGR